MTSKALFAAELGSDRPKPPWRRPGDVLAHGVAPVADDFYRGMRSSWIHRSAEVCRDPMTSDITPSMPCLAPRLSHRSFAPYSAQAALFERGLHT